MPYFSYFMGWFVIMFFQIVVSPRIAVAGIYPDIILAAVILLGLKRGWKAGFWFGLVFGLSIDLLNPVTLGWNTLLLSLCGLAGGAISGKIYVENNLYQVGIVAVIAFIFHLLMRIIESVGFLMRNFSSSLIDSLFIAIFTAIVAGASLVLLQQRYRLKELL